MPRTKEANRLRMRVYRELYPDRIKASSAKHYYENRVKYKEDGKRRYLENRERCNKQSAARHAIYREKDNAYLREYRIKNKDRIKALQLQNKDRKTEWRKAYEKANPEKIREQRAKKYARHRVKSSARYAAYAKANPEIIRKKNNARRARKSNASIGNLNLITKWERAWKSKKRVRCYWCGNLFDPKTCHSDHVIALVNKGPHSIENLCISCQPCNNGKHAKPLSVWNTQIREPVLL